VTSLHDLEGDDPRIGRAIAWALDHLGSPNYDLRCLSFVEDAYEKANAIEVFGGSSAKESAELYGAADSEGEPPPGAFVFFDTHGVVDGVDRDWGHVGLAIGDGRMVSAWEVVRVDRIADFPTVESGSWSQPVYVGFAPPERVLRDAVRRAGIRESR
jgi:cell wall-associated NlpC family hydrolase